MPVRSTIPGTLTNVTPDMLAPTMPKATIYQGERRLARKNVLLSERRAVKWLNSISAAKYAATVRSIVIVLESFFLTVGKIKALSCNGKRITAIKRSFFGNKCEVYLQAFSPLFCNQMYFECTSMTKYTRQSAS